MSAVRRRMLPIGIENFKEICSEDYYYVDKTAMIYELFLRRGKVNLFTQPRRSGKSLNMSMLRQFFEINSSQPLFKKLEISKNLAFCNKHMGKYPVIYISLKGVKGADYCTSRSLMCSIIGNEAARFYQTFYESEKLNEIERKQYECLIHIAAEGKGIFEMSDAVLMESLKKLSMLLEKHFGQKVILLIDEYDVPLETALGQGYYKDMLLLIRNLFEQTLKTNDSLYFAVLAGRSWLSQESIFEGLNNPKVFSADEHCNNSYFGFTDNEVKALLYYYEMDDKYDLIRERYGGDKWKDTNIYCPGDVIGYVDKVLAHRK